MNFFSTALYSFFLFFAFEWIASQSSPSVAQEVISPKSPQIYAAPKSRTSPDLTPSSVQSGFVSGFGDYYFYVAPYAYELYSYPTAFTRGSSTWQLDTSMGAGLGFGSMESIGSIQISVNQTGLRQSNRGSTLDIKAGRYIVNQPDLKIALSLGSIGLISTGINAQVPTYTIAASAAFPIKFEGSTRTVQINLGGGNGEYFEPGSPSLLEQGIFGSIGLEIADGVGLSMGVAGGETSLKLSLAPLEQDPLRINLTVGNLFDNDGFGRSVTLGMTWGGNFQAPTF